MTTGKQAEWSGFYSYALHESKGLIAVHENVAPTMKARKGPYLTLFFPFKEAP